MEPRLMKSIIASAIPNQSECVFSAKTVADDAWPQDVGVAFRLKKITTATMLLALVYLCASNPSYALETRYITDVFEVTMRSGTSTSNSIVRMLGSGEAVSVLEEDLASQYSLVETSAGKQGYVLSRFLMEEPAAKQTLLELQESFAQQQQRLK
jgi:uncharacterized protein YgiM (DUF1202 family)